jgi:hypothetical protein
MNPESFELMTRNAIKRTEAFSNSEFSKRVRFVVQRGFASMPFRLFLENRLKEVSKIELKLEKNLRNVAVIVEPGFNPGFEFCVKNVMKHLGRNWSLHVFHSTENDIFVKSALSSIEGITYSILSSITVVNDYNQFLKTSQFWEEIIGEKVLIFQADSLMLLKNIDSFMSYDFIGAPWHLQNERWGLIQSLGLLDGVGNGGFSLRSKSAMVEIASLYGSNSPVSEQEDIFFASHSKKLGYNVADRITAYSFCQEVPCSDLKFEGTPMAIHAAWYYFDNITIDKYFSQSLVSL